MVQQLARPRAQGVDAFLAASQIQLFRRGPWPGPCLLVLLCSCAGSCFSHSAWAELAPLQSCFGGSGGACMLELLHASAEPNL